MCIYIHVHRCTHVYVYMSGGLLHRLTFLTRPAELSPVVTGVSLSPVGSPALDRQRDMS